MNLAYSSQSKMTMTVAQWLEDAKKIKWSNVLFSSAAKVLCWLGQILGAWLQSPPRPFQWGSSGLWDDVERRLSEGRCIPYQPGHLFPQWHSYSHSHSGPVLDSVYYQTPFIPLASGSSTRGEQHLSISWYLGNQETVKRETVRGSSVSIARFYKI